MVDGFGRRLNPSFMDVLARAEASSLEVRLAHVQGRPWAKGTTSVQQPLARQAAEREYDEWMLEYCTNPDEIMDSTDHTGYELYSKSRLDAVLRELSKLGAPRLTGRTFASLYSLDRIEKCREIAWARQWAMHWALIVQDRERPWRDRQRKRRRGAADEQGDDEQPWIEFEAKSAGRLAHPLHSPPL